MLISSFIKTHLNFDIMLKLLDVMDDIDINKMELLKLSFDDYIKINTYKLLESS